MTESYNRLWSGMLDQAIDESLRVKSDKNMGVTMQTVVNARKWIQTDEFRLLYKVVHHGDPTELVKMLRRMWAELGRDESKSLPFRNFFNPDVGRPGLKELQLKHPEDWTWTRLTGYMEMWDNV